MTGLDVTFLVMGISLLVQKNREERSHSCFQEVLRAYLNNKLNSIALSHTSHPTEWQISAYSEISFFDPTVFCVTDFCNQNQKLIAKRGDAFNPLMQIPLEGRLWILDGKRSDQVRWAAKQKEICLVVGGEHAVKLGAKNMLFDPRGLIPQMLKIKTLPSCITQKGDQLRLEPIPALAKQVKPRKCHQTWKPKQPHSASQRCCA